MRGVRYVVLGRTTAPQTLDYLGTSGVSFIVSELFTASLSAAGFDDGEWRATRPIGFNEQEHVECGPDEWPSTDTGRAYAPLVHWLEIASRTAG